MKKPRTNAKPTQRSLKKLRDEGYELVEVVEKWIPGANIRKDLFGFIDILATKGNEVLAVQTTTGESNMYQRIKKIAEHENIGAVRKLGWTIHVHGWWKKANGRWECRVKDVS
jgi:hypothetical protein